MRAPQWTDDEIRNADPKTCREWPAFVSHEDALFQALGAIGFALDSLESRDPAAIDKAKEALSLALSEGLVALGIKKEAMRG